MESALSATPSMADSGSPSSFAQLARLMDEVSRASSLDAVYQRAISTLREALRIERAAVLLLDRHGVMRFVAWSGLSDQYRRAVEGHSPWPPDLRDPTPVLIEDVSQAPDLARYGDLFVREGIGALAFVPLQHAGRLLGKFMLYHGTPHRFTSEEVGIAAAVAGHVAFAVERLRIERELDDARHALEDRLANEYELRRRAEEAVRARDETVAIVSHDLRDPLGTICSGCALLELDPAAALQAGTPAAMMRAATQMQRLVQDLLDVARIEAGGLSLDVKPVEVGGLLTETVSLFQTASRDKSVRLEVSVEPGLAAARADRGRLQQVLSNLIGNAIKFARRNGQVEVTAVSAGDSIRFSVTDDGPGIAAEQLPRLFDRFWQAERSQRGGAGLGLAIAKGIVEAHGGTIEVRTELGRGSTFSFLVAAARRVAGGELEPPTAPLLEIAAE
jgi:signal transduction histidine kinase